MVQSTKGHLKRTKWRALESTIGVKEAILIRANGSNLKWKEEVFLHIKMAIF